jgi:RTX calcium-binding nonapeptide repeat (4 copies)
MRLICVAAVLALGAGIAAGVPGALAGPTAPGCPNPIVGTPQADDLRGTPAGDRITGLAGNDALRGNEGADCLIGGPGDDAAWGGSGGDRLSGNEGADHLLGEAGADLVIGGPGDDRIDGGGGRDVVRSGTGNDRIDEVGYEYRAGWTPDLGRNELEAGPGVDIIDVANGHRDTVRCGPGRDSVRADRVDVLKACEHRRRLSSPLPSTVPRAGGRHGTFVIGFRSLGAIDPPGMFFSIRVDGPPGGSCRRIVGNSVGVAYARDQFVRYRLRSFRGFGRAAPAWCLGRYKGQVSLMRRIDDSCDIRPSALPNASCVATMHIGRFTFRVR